MGRIVSTMGLIQEHNPSFNMVQFTYEHILRNNAWLSSGILIDQSKSVEHSVIYIIPTSTL